MKKLKKMLSMILALSLVCCFNPIIVKAGNTYSSATITIDSQWSTNLQTEIETLAGGASNFGNITTLNITAGELTDEDVSWLTENLSGLQNLSITEDAYFTLEDDGISCILPDCAFGNEITNKLSNLLNVTIDVNDNIQLKFGRSAFYSCNLLQSVSIPEAKSFGDYAFYDCSELTNISLLNVITIGEVGFNNCAKLTSVSLPKLEYVGSHVFAYCNKQIIFTLGATEPSLSPIAFISCDAAIWNSIVVVPEISVFLYDVRDENIDGKYYGWTIVGSSIENQITDFSIKGQISSTIDEVNRIVTIVMPYGTDLTSLTPAITVSDSATASPNTNIAQNFTEPVTYKVTSEYGNTSDYTINVTVQIPPTLYQVTVNNGSGDGTYAEGATVTITADTAANGKTFKTWKVESGSVALISSTSETTTFTMPAGKVVITASYENTQSTVKAEPSVLAPTVAPTTAPRYQDKVKATSSKTLYLKGNTGKTTTIVITKPDAAVIASKTFKSNNTSVATVSALGKVTAKKVGKATITTTVTLSNGEVATLKTTIKVKNAFVKFTSTKATIFKGKSFKFKVNASGSSKKITWKVSNSKYGKITSNGKFIAKAKGKVKITATSGTISRTFTVKVK